MPAFYRYRLLFLLQVALLLCTPFPKLHAQWVKLSQFNTGTFYNEVFFFDQNFGLITSHDGAVLRTTNGGSTWGTVTLPDATFSANRDICIVSSSVAYISGEDGVWKSTNGGANWTEITPAGTTTLGSSSSWFRNESVGIWGYGNCADTLVTFWRTTDGGANWNSVTYSHSIDVAVGGMTYSAGTFYAAGSSGKFWQSTDDGVTWSLSNTNSAGWQEDLISYGGNLFIASADGTSCNANGGGKILRSTNGGSSWTTTSYANTVMWGVSMYSSSDGWAAGDFGKAYKTTDGGGTWAESSCGLDPTDRLDDIWMIDATHGFIVGDGIYRYAVNEFVAKPDTIDFGDVIVNSTAGDSMAIIRAVGATGTITARAILGTDAAQFLSPAPLSAALVVPECNEAATPIRFQPTSIGPKTARMEFTITGVSAPLVVYLKGRGVKPKMIGPKFNRFDTLICNQELTDTITFSNNGDFPLRIDSARMVNDVGFFTLLSPTLPIEIPPLRNQEFIIRGRAVGTGQMSGRLYIYSNDPDYKDSTWVTSLTMYKKRIEVGISPDTLIVIPSRPTDSTSSFCLFYKNTGETDLTVGPISTFSGDPTITTTFSGTTTVKPGDSITICFTARAPDTLQRCKRFRVVSQPCSIETFVTVCYQAAEGRLDLPKTLSIDADCGQTKQGIVRIYNRGNDTARIAGAGLIGPDRSLFALLQPTVWPQAIPAGDSLDVLLTFAPDGTKAVSKASLVVNLSDGSRDTISIEGTLRAPIVDLKESFNNFGAICPNESLDIVVRLTNSGTAGTKVIGVSPLNSEARIAVTRMPDQPIAPANGTDSILFTITASPSGTIVNKYVVTYDSPCLEPDTITITGIVLDSSLSVAPSPIDFGVVAVSKVGVARTVVRNNSDTIVQVRISDPGIPGLTLTHPTSVVQLEPGDTIQVTLRLSSDIEITLNDILLVEGTGRCDEERRVPLKGSVVAQAIYLSGNLDFGIIRCDAPAVDTIMLYNQSSNPIRLSSVVLSDDRGFSFALPNALPIDLAAGDSIPIVITVTPGTFGPFTATITLKLDGGSVAELTATIQAERQGTDTRFVRQDGTPLPPDALVLPPMDHCSTTFDTVLTLKNSGNIPDVLDVTSDLPAIVTITSPLPVTLDPGQSKDVEIHLDLSTIDLSTAATFKPMVRATSQVCGTIAEVQSSVEYVRLESLEGGTVSFGEKCVGRDTILVRTLKNPSGYPITVKEIQIAGDNVFTTLSSSSFILPAGATTNLGLTFKPSAEQSFAGELRIITDSPCLDTIVLALSGDGVACAVPDITVRAGDIRGRWGTMQSVPVTLSGFNSSLIQELKLTMTVAPTLLHPENIRLSDWAVGKWTIGGQTYNPTDGTLTITLSQSVVGAPVDPANTELEDQLFFAVDYRVLRGDSISGFIDLISTSVVPEGSVTTSGATFVLEDYCDAYGRLLRTTGNLALRPSVPNPASGRAVIEYELPFGDRAELALFDARGTEVLRPLDEVVPAGRRQTVIDVSALPSGVYTIRLRIGLQTITERMVVAK